MTEQPTQPASREASDMVALADLRDPDRLTALVQKAVAAFNALTPEQQEEHLCKQRESYVRAEMELSRLERGETHWRMPAALLEQPATPGYAAGFEACRETLAKFAREQRDFARSQKRDRECDEYFIAVGHESGAQDMMNKISALSAPAPAATKLIDPIESVGMKGARAEAIKTHASMFVPASPAASALSDIAAERQRQVKAEGWSTGHDDTHVSGELAMAAACYALASFLNTEHSLNTTFTRYWPWDRKWWKPKSSRENLVRAGALIVAEIERLDRFHITAKANEGKWMSEQHRLVDNTLTRDTSGITTTCKCGWTSTHFSSLAASAAFQDHREKCEKHEGSQQ